MPPAADVKLRIVAENLARAALQEAKRDVEGVGAAAGGSSVGFGKMVFSQGNLIASTSSARNAVNMFEHAMRTLSFEAAGIPGPIGKAGSAIGILGVGSGPVLIATAALGLFALAWKKADEAAQLAADNAVSAGERLHRVFASVMKSADEPVEGLSRLRRALKETKDEFASAQIAPLPAPRFEQRATAGGLVSVQVNDPAQEHADAVTAADNKMRAAQLALDAAQRDAADAADKATNALERQGDVLAATIGIRERAIVSGQSEGRTLVAIAEATAREQAATMGLDAAHTAALVTQARRVALLQGEQRILEATGAAQRQADLVEATNAIRQHAIDIGQDEATTLGEIAEATARAQAATLGIDAAHTAALVTQAKRIERLKEENSTLEAQRDLLVQIDQIAADVSGFFAQPFQQEIIAAIKVPTLPDILAQEGQRQAGLQTAEIEKQGGQFAFGNFDQTFFDNVQQGVNDALATTPGFKNGGMIMAHAFTAAVGDFARGGAAGAFAGAGELLTGASQVKQFAGAAPVLEPLGFAFSAVSSLISVFDGSAERRHKEMIRELKKISERPNLEGRVLQPIYLNDRGRTGVYQAGRDQERDAVDRGLDRP